MIIISKLKTIYNFMIVGVSNIIPGISGGTILLISGMYEYTIDSVLKLKDPTKRHEALKFIFISCIGIVLGIILGSSLISKALEINYPIVMTVFASLLFFSTLNFSYDNFNEENKFHVGTFLITLVLFGTLIYNTLDNPVPEKVLYVPELSINLLILLSLSGFIAGFTMIFPGVSGSLILLSIGTYVYFISFVSISLLMQLSLTHIIYLLGMMFGIFFGVTSSVMFSNHLFTNYKSKTLSAIMALIVVSIVKLIYEVIRTIETFSFVTLILITCSILFSHTALKLISNYSNK